MKAVMYHYVRRESAEYPHFRYLHVDNFKKQLDFFQKNFQFIERDRFARILTGEASLAESEIKPEEILLTFDDGFSDHYDYVLPELSKRGLWAYFFIPSGPYREKKLLDVHRVHYLLGKFGGEKMMHLLAKHIDIDDFVSEKKKYERTTYLGQQNTEATALFKKAMNYYLSVEMRDELLSFFIRELFGDESRLQENFYLSREQIDEMEKAGMWIAAHSKSHTALSKLDPSEQKVEIEDSFAFIEECINSRLPRSFCYPYGGVNSYTLETEKILSQAGSKASFCVDPREITLTELKNRPHALPRFDCNQFEFGKSH